MPSRAFEVNFDGIVGPTHNYAGLAYGNVASQKHGLTMSHPKAAALQGLAKMKFLHDLGVRQAVLPPPPRPDVATLRRLGFAGSDADVLGQAHRQSPRLLAAVYSASAMWAANAAMVSPGADCRDGRVHFTPANLITQFHRSIEPPTTAALLRAIFPEGDAFAHHDPLPAADAFADEGAANHMRLCASHGEAGLEIFVYGRSAFSGTHSPARFPARQTLEACQAIARRHQLPPERTIFIQQNPAAVNAGVFHNDVVAVSNENVLLFHAAAYENSATVVEEIRRKFAAISGRELFIIAADPAELSLAEAVESYVFNSQLVTLADGAMAMIAPMECCENSRVRAFLQQVMESDNPIRSVHYLDVRQSMNNGGGPACLRLRVVMTDEQLQLAHAGVMFSEPLYAKLLDWIERNYRESIQMDDLADPSLMRESEAAAQQLTGILGLELV
jgi:succinylarginine dihydrolase